MTNSPNNSRPITEVTDPCRLLPQLRAAYYALIAGQQTVEIRDGDRWRRFGKGDAKLLQEEIARLERRCGNCRGGTLYFHDRAGGR